MARYGAGAMQPVSPCISVCRIDQRTGHCKGCYRTVAEVAAWRMASPEEQIDILKAIAARLLADGRPPIGDRRERLRHRLAVAGVLQQEDEAGHN